jgi:hypothetical protein
MGQVCTGFALKRMSVWRRRYWRAVGSPFDVNAVVAAATTAGQSVPSALIAW